MSIGYNSELRHYLIGQYVKMASIDSEQDFIPIAEKFSTYVRKNIGKYAINFAELNGIFEMDFILVGYDNDVAKTPKIISVDSSNIKTPFSLREFYPYYFGGIDNIGINWAKKIHLAKLILPVEFLKKFAVMVIKETINYSNMCSEPIQMALVDTKGYHDISNDVDSIKATIDSKNKWLDDYLENKG